MDGDGASRCLVGLVVFGKDIYTPVQEGSRVTRKVH